MKKGLDYEHSREKRAVDLLCTGGTGAVLAIPALLAVINSKREFGEIFYRQERTSGSVGRVIIPKFKTVDATIGTGEHDMNGVEHRVESGEVQGTIDTRTSRVSNSKRIAGIDEYPQLLLVLSGKMSYVNPRPTWCEAMDEYYDASPRLFDKWRGAISLVKGGLMSPAAKLGKQNGNDCPDTIQQKMELDIKQVYEQTLLTDLQLVASMPLTVANALGRFVTHREKHS